MDSFYDAPRRAIIPQPPEKFLPAPVVPEISVLCSIKQPTNEYTPYTAWKMQENRKIPTANKENMPHIANSQNNMSYLKKQVRFGSPVLQQPIKPNYEPVLPKKTPENVPQALLGGKTFEQIYLENIPNRHLDLSLIEPKVIEKEAKTENISKEIAKEDVKPKTYKEFCDLRQDDSVIDIFNYKKQAASNSSFKRDLPYSANHKEQNKQCEYNSKLNNVFNDQKKCFIDDIRNPAFRDDYKRTDLPILSKNKDIRQETTHTAVNNGDILGHLPHYTPRVNSNNFQNISPYSLPVQKDATNIDCQRFPARNFIQKCDVSTQTDPIPAEEKPKDQPALNDLLKIISQQNEQLLLLQRQVSSLLSKGTCQKRLEQPPQTEKYVTSTQHDNFPNPALQDTPRKRLQKFSIDMMTSFEVSFRRQPKNRELFNHEPKIQEITETESCSPKSDDRNDDATCVDTSMCLKEPIKVREACPSPEPSIKIDMNDYESSGSDEDAASDMGPMFYDNLMGQVNKILKKAHIQTREDAGSLNVPPGGVSEESRNKTMNKVKVATLRHLKSIGISVPNFDDVSLDSCSSNSDEDSEISFAVKQLLMKYLPDEHLSRVVQKQQNDRNIGIIPNRPEFSFATVQYMKKYNLIASGGEETPQLKKTPNMPKILDISKLKQQPKLM